MQLCKYFVNLKNCIGQKFNVIVIKATHRRSNFFETLVSQEIFASKARFKKKSVLKFPEFSIWKMLFAFLQKHLVFVAMRMEEVFYNISTYSAIPNNRVPWKKRVGYYIGLFG